MRKVLPLLLLTSVAACAFPQTRWDKPGATEKATADDQVACRHAARQEAFDSYPYGPLPWHVRHWAYYGDDQFYAEGRLTDFCMRNKGYTLVTVTPPKAGAPPAQQPPPAAPATDK